MESVSPRRLFPGSRVSSRSTAGFCRGFQARLPGGALPVQLFDRRGEGEQCVPFGCDSIYHGDERILQEALKALAEEDQGREGPQQAQASPSAFSVFMSGLGNTTRRSIPTISWSARPVVRIESPYLML
nr:uncharacterized protein LOC127337222 isoform X2 [Lolium perenne]